MIASLFDIYSNLDEPMRSTMLKRIDNNWVAKARPSQRVPPTSDVHIVHAGRGWGKTRMGVEWILEKAEDPNASLLAVASTQADMRQVIVEGASGILRHQKPSNPVSWDPRRQRLSWASGALCEVRSSTEPISLRGIQAHASWMDEPHHVRRPDGLSSFDMVRIATRLGPQPQVLVTGTPNRSNETWNQFSEMRASFAPGVTFTQGDTSENEPNLIPNWIKIVRDTYAGTGREYTELEGNLWSPTF